MSDWKTLKQKFLSRKQNLDTNTTDQAVQSTITTMNDFISNYTNSAGISQNPTSNSDYTSANELFKKIQSYEKEYVQLNKEVSEVIRGLSGSSDIDNKLQEVGTLQQSILKSKKELESLTQDVDTSLSRQYSIEHPRQELSWHQGFSAKMGFTKPLYQTSVACMIGLGILLLFLSTLMLRDFFSTSQGAIPAPSGSIDGMGSVFSVFTDSRFLSLLTGVSLSLIVIVVLSVKGYFGKNLR